MEKYEFTEEENTEIMKLAKYMKITAILVIVFGALALVFSVLSADLIGSIYFVFFIIAGISFYMPTDNFRRIAKTEGSDIEELIKGFKELTNFWNVVIIILVVLLVIDIIL
jgi:hypothetical protein